MYKWGLSLLLLASAGCSLELNGGQARPNSEKTSTCSVTCAAGASSSAQCPAPEYVASCKCATTPEAACVATGVKLETH